VCDTGNNRVLVFNTVPVANGASANVVIGQANMTSAVASNAAGGMHGPTAVCVAGSALLVADTSNHRVLVFSTVPTADGTAANLVIGQDNFDESFPNGGATAASDSTLLAPTGVAYHAASGSIAIADTLNHRVLIFGVLPVANGASATNVFGQPGYASGLPNNGGISARAADFTGTYVCGIAWDVADKAIWIPDHGNRRAVRVPVP
jgi:hypothetical protein